MDLNCWTYRIRTCILTDSCEHQVETHCSTKPFVPIILFPPWKKDNKRYRSTCKIWLLLLPHLPLIPTSFNSPREIQWPLSYRGTIPEKDLERFISQKGSEGRKLRNVWFIFLFSSYQKLEPNGDRFPWGKTTANQPHWIITHVP